MADLIVQFQERLSEVETYLDFLSDLETLAREGPPRLEGSSRPMSVQQQRILYSSVYLQLYNLIESTMSRCFDAISEAATSSRQWRPFDLSDALRREWVRSTARTHGNLGPEKRLKNALRLFEILIEAEPLADFEIERGAGSWDDASIETFSKRVGCELRVSESVYTAVKRPFRDDMGPLALVKRLRNELAHGSISFAQCAEEMTVGRLIELKERTADYLREVIECFTAYLENFQYLLPARRPT